jgi:toxin ParE1/3/4
LPGFVLTRRAARDLRDIHKRSVANWGDARADRYLDDIYAAFARIADNPETGRLRSHRSTRS